MREKKIIWAGVGLIFLIIFISSVIERIEYTTFYEVNCEEGQFRGCQPSGRFVRISRDLPKAKVTIELFDADDSLVSREEQDHCVFKGFEMFACERRRTVTLSAAGRNFELAAWKMSGRRISHEYDQPGEVYWVNRPEHARRAILAGWDM